jgi:hypothetical protein
MVLLCLAVSVISITKKSRTDSVFSSEPIDYIITAWAEKSAVPDLAAPIDDLEPQKIIVEYHVSVQGESAEQQSALCGEYARQASADFRRRFTPMLGDFNIGAVRFETHQEED